MDIQRLSLKDEKEKKTAPRRRRSLTPPPTMSETRIVLVGKTGAGKSSSGNTILGKVVFRSAHGSSSVTKECSKVTGKVGERTVTVVDTPGLFDTSQRPVQHEIGKCINMSSPGPHVIIIVIRVGTFTPEERQTVDKVEDVFGLHANKHAMILFTHGDEFERSIEESLKEAPEDLQKVLKRFGNRYHVFNNKKMDNRTQVLELLEKIDKLVAENDGAFYSNNTYQEVEVKLKEREEELKRLFEEKMREREKELKEKYLEKRRKLEEKIKTIEQTVEEKDQKIKELEEEKRKLERNRDIEVQEVKRFYTDNMKTARHVAEQVPYFMENPSEFFLKFIQSGYISLL